MKDENDFEGLKFSWLLKPVDLNPCVSSVSTHDLKLLLV